MSVKLDTLTQHLNKHLADKVTFSSVALREITLDVDVAQYYDVMTILRDQPELGFEQLIDLCGVDYSDYGHGPWEGKRFAAVTHLLSISNNWRLRVRCFAEDDGFPAIPSIVSIWNAANWFEREAFDLFGIVFPGHEDLRRILTDYGFIGHPFRKDFPVSGYVEMRYDQDQQRLIYEPVSIEPREDVPRIVRESGYGESENA